ncbi:MAG TPA: OB-fold domain-containing protein [Acidimicrobiia bacterium]|nr:OB-fold domain-containing protein [Acidimicrobiia bacterium]
MASISKRRAGEAHGGPAVADPRPRLVDGLVGGWRCQRCNHAVAQESPWCPVCSAAPLQPATFGPGGTVWAGTLVHLPVGEWPPPFGLASVDLDDGPRVLAHTTEAVVLAPGTRVRLVRTGGPTVFVEPDPDPEPDPAPAGADGGGS